MTSKHYQYFVIFFKFCARWKKIVWAFFHITIENVLWISFHTHGTTCVRENYNTLHLNRSKIFIKNEIRFLWHNIQNRSETYSLKFKFTFLPWAWRTRSQSVCVYQCKWKNRLNEVIINALSEKSNCIEIIMWCKFFCMVLNCD